MKLLKASAVIIGMTFALAACNKTQDQNAANDNAANAVVPETAAPAENATDMNAVDVNNVAAPDNGSARAPDDDNRTDTGPRPPTKG